MIFLGCWGSGRCIDDISGVLRVGWGLLGIFLG